MSLGKEQSASGAGSATGSASPLRDLPGLPETPTTVAAQTVIDQVREHVSSPFTAAFMAGGVAGAVSRTVVSPLERLKILYQIQGVGREEFKLSVLNGLKKMWSDEGWRGFMRGNGTNCVRIIPYSAVQFGSYSIYKKVCRPSSVS